MVKTLEERQSYDSPELLQTLVKKSPSYLQNKWGVKAMKIRRGGEEVKLGNFIELVEEATVLVTDPLFSHEALYDGLNAQEDFGKGKRALVMYIKSINKADNSVSKVCTMFL